MEPAILVWLVLLANLPLVHSNPSLQDEQSPRSRRSLVAQCPRDTFERDLYCIKRCGAGFYGNTRTGKCEKCSTACKTCFDGTRNNKCSSCYDQYFLSDNTCLALCKTGYLSQGPPIRNIRLVGNNKPFQGRVEVFKFGSWGTICDDGWDIRDANVVCRELMLGEALEAVTLGGQGQGMPTQKIHLSGVGCYGNESRIDACAHALWEENRCGHFEDAGVRCKGPDVTKQCVKSCGPGYYLVKDNQACGTCDSTCLTCANSSTSCLSCDKPRFLKGNKCLMDCGDGYYGNEATRLCQRCDANCRTCSASATSCTSCSIELNRYLFNSTCHADCGKTHIKQQVTIRLSGKRSSSFEGRVEVLRAGGWQTVCDETFDFREATVVCRQLGMGRAIKAVRNGGFGTGLGRIWVDKLNCTGSENDIFDCPKQTMHWNSRCYHVNDAGVVCAGPQVGIPLSNRCVGTCPEGNFKNTVDTCQKCASQCAACIGSSVRCTKCTAPKFHSNNSCLTKCEKNKYGNTKTRECLPCDTSICVTCANGVDGKNCSSCRAPYALKDGKCTSSCGPDLFELSGKCVSDCGSGYYKYTTNSTCLPCPAECFRCEFRGGKPQCTVCKPPKVFENGACATNCTAGRVSVPESNSKSATVRLVNGSDYLEGRVEVFHNGVWGTVCDDSWDSKEATVVCRQLHLGLPAIKPIGKIAKGTAKIWLDDLWCVGSEASLGECRHRPWGESNCNHNEDVAIRCRGPGMRKCADKCPDGQYARGSFCQVCDVSCATCVDSPNKCLQCAPGFYLNGTNQCLKSCGLGYYLDAQRIRCQSCDPVCATCDVIPGNCTSCSPPNFRTGSTCKPDCQPGGYKPAPIHGIRLVNGKTSLQGRVEVLFNNQWGTICDDGFDIRDANVICNMLNFGNATKAHTAAFFGRGTGSTWLDDLDCKGGEATLSKCRHRGWGIENCEHSEDAGVTCSGPDTSQDCLPTCGAGYYKNMSANTCGKCSSDCQECDIYPDNCTACVEGEYLNGTTPRTVCVQDCGTGFFPANDVCNKCTAPCFTCSGTSTNCTGCGARKVLDSSRCEDDCGKNSIVSGVSGIRLVGANSSVEGRLEIMYQRAWGTVCDDGFDMNDATVACRQLKLGKAKAFKGGAAYGPGKGKIVMDDMQCENTEQSLFDCKQHPAGTGHSNCGHAEDVGITCTGPDMSKKCVKTCPSGYYDDKHVCKRCFENCMECTGTAYRCTKCSPPSFLKPGAEVNGCTGKCPLGFYGDTVSRVCKKCSDKCQTCMNGNRNTICKTCAPGLFLNDSKCISSCGDMQSVADLLPTRPAIPSVRLVGGKNKQEGRVEIFHEGAWGTVCDDDWDVKDASVVCRELGFGKALQAPLHAKFGKGSGIIWMDNVDCYGYESSLTQCRNHGWGINNCDAGHGEDAGVVCDNSTIEDVANNYCRKVIPSKCQDVKTLCFNGVTCIDLELLTNQQQQGSICLQCPDNYVGDGQTCRVVSSVAPEFQVTPPNNITVNTESVLRLGCRSKAPVVTPLLSDWLKDGKPLSPKDVKALRITTTTSGQLVVNNVQRSDAGNYTCVLRNSAAYVTASTIVTVNEPPRILDFVPALVTKGETAFISCDVSSFPPANISWKKKGVEISGSKYKIFPRNFTLAIINAQFGDSGQYECTAANSLGAASANVSVNVGLPSKINVTPESITVAVQQQVVLKCEAGGQPTPMITWKKDGVLVATDSNHVIERGTLTIKRATRVDVGYYGCIARNPQNIDTAFAAVIVIGIPVIDVPPQNASVLTSANLSFYCQALGSPAPIITWVHNGKIIQEKPAGTTRTKNTLVLTAVTPEDAGSVVCNAHNSYGSVSRTAYLTVDGQLGVYLLTTTGPNKSVSTGTIVAIVVILLAIVLVIVGIVVYKYWRGRNQATAGYRYEIGGDSGKPDKLTQLKIKMRSGASNPIEDNTFDDSKPFVDHDTL